MLQVIGNTWAVHHDPEQWDNPDQFKPERFIDENRKFIPAPSVMPYGYGSRYCTGKKMADWLLFHNITGIVRKFQLLPEPDVVLPSLDETVFGTLNMTLPFNAIFKAR